MPFYTSNFAGSRIISSKHDPIIRLYKSSILLGIGKSIVGNSRPNSLPEISAATDIDDVNRLKQSIAKVVYKI